MRGQVERFLEHRKTEFAAKVLSKIKDPLQPKATNRGRPPKDFEY